MQIFRRAFDKYQSNKHAFVLPLLFSVVLLYFFPFVAPIPRHYLPRDYRSAFSLFLSVHSSFDSVKNGTYEIVNFVEYILLPTILAIIAIYIAALKKHGLILNKLSAFSLIRISYVLILVAITQPFSQNDFIYASKCFLCSHCGLPLSTIVVSVVYLPIILPHNVKLINNISYFYKINKKLRH